MCTCQEFLSTALAAEDSVISNWRVLQKVPGTFERNRDVRQSALNCMNVQVQIRDLPDALVEYLNQGHWTPLERVVPRNNMGSRCQYVDWTSFEIRVLQRGLLAVQLRAHLGSLRKTVVLVASKRRRRCLSVGMIFDYPLPGPIVAQADVEAMKAGEFAVVE